MATTACIKIMQGRLLPPCDGRFQSFPRGHWEKEFAFAAEAGLNGIEWIYDTYGEGDNPIEKPSGQKLLATLCRDFGVIVDSLCADYFLDRPLLRSDGPARVALEAKLHWLIGAASDVGVRRLVLPFVDASQIDDEDDEREVVAILERALPVAEKSGIELHLETSLQPARFASLLQALDHELVCANYDSGNSASLGYSPREEFAAYGRRIGSVHVKDRVRGGGTVPLESGDCDFKELFTSLRDVGYPGDYVLQVARTTSCSEGEWAARNVHWLRERLVQYAIACPPGATK